MAFRLGDKYTYMSDLKLFQHNNQYYIFIMNDIKCLIRAYALYDKILHDAVDSSHSLVIKKGRCMNRN